MYRIATALLCLCACNASAAQVYKCVQHGKVTYSETPCPGARVTQLAPPALPAPTEADPEALQSLQAKKKLADKLAAAREKREEKHARETQQARRAAALQFRKCEKLRLRKKWADEDAAGTRNGDEIRSLQRKAARATEALKVECPG